MTFALHGPRHGFDTLLYLPMVLHRTILGLHLSSEEEMQTGQQPVPGSELAV